MNPFSPQIMSEIRQLLGCPSLGLEVSPHWGSTNEGYREQIHAEIRKLGLAPESVSISHTRGLGGFAYSTDPKGGLGFDIENSLRVTPAIARRISLSQDEFEAAPSPEALWVAKESSFKALRGPRQPQVIVGLEIGAWQARPSQLETFQLLSIDGQKLATSGIGVSIAHNLFTFGLIFIPSHY